MFTGIVASTAKIKTIEKAGSGIRMLVEAKDRKLFSDIVIGESIAVSGVCLTVETLPTSGEFTFFLSEETLARSSLGDLKSGNSVNLERALKANAGLSGHIVQGHVDGIAVCEAVEPVDGSWKLSFRVPGGLGRYMVAKGSVTLDGVSLTINGISEKLDASQQDHFNVMIIPHTWEITTLRHAAPGHRFNVEVDVIAKYVERLMSRR